MVERLTHTIPQRATSEIGRAMKKIKTVLTAIINLTLKQS
jgi:hypothetical protein